MTTAPNRIARYRVAGMDCADCAAEIERAVRELAGVTDARVSLASGLMTVRLDSGIAPLPAIEHAVQALGYGASPIDGASGSSSSETHLAPGYKRALGIVVVLNIGYGVVEAAGGFFSGSQAVKADALDFLGDGLISLLGLLAIGWSLIWRARAALLQGAFLGLLGLGVLGSTLYRVVVQDTPEAGLMGLLGLGGLIVNVAAAMALIPHRSGDANARAVWLFSRNDALGNLAVVIAALLIGGTGSAWPDIIVAIAIATLFLHSSWRILSDALSEVRGQRSGVSEQGTGMRAG
jgi:Co/Zn/Cd efflux system component/copper chaperone CopZ